MAGHTLTASMPPITLTAGCTVTFEALDPSTGAEVTGVAISEAAYHDVNFVDDTPPVEQTLPVFVPVPDTEQAVEA